MSVIRSLKSTAWGQWLLNLIPVSLKASLRQRLDRWNTSSIERQILAQASQTNDLLAHIAYQQARQNPSFQDPLRLLGNGFKIYSQHDEDGIIEEIFRRIGTTDCRFVEFGVGDGMENCTTYLLLKDWQGVWLDGSAYCVEQIQQNLAHYIAAQKLKVKYTFITAENIESLFREMGVPAEFDFLSIDIDRNDLWVWEGIKNYRPRVVAVEYNASFGPSAAVSIPYAPTEIWDGSNFSGASLKALELVGRRKGYSLVGCNYTGVTAFFVRNDLVEDRFRAPFTAENHFSPARFFVRMPNGHRPKFGPVTRIASGT